MANEQIEALTLGSAFTWEFKGGEVRRTAEAAIGYHIIGMPPGFDADIGPTHGHGGGAVYVHSKLGAQQPDDPANSYESKEHAFEGLKAWLRAQPRIS